MGGTQCWGAVPRPTCRLACTQWSTTCLCLPRAPQEICAVYAALVAKNEAYISDPFEAAKAARDALLVSLYILIPPSRCKEYRLLSVDSVSPTNIDIGTNYKTAAFYGPGHVPITSTALRESLFIYVRDHRGVLAAKSGDAGTQLTLLLNDRGAPYSQSRYSSKVGPTAARALVLRAVPVSPRAHQPSPFCRLATFSRSTAATARASASL